MKLAMESADIVADDFEDEEIPEETEEDGLTEEEAALAVEKLVDVANALSDKVGHVDPDFQKIASATPLGEAASIVVMDLIKKTAAEGPIMPGQTPPAIELEATNEALVDAQSNPSQAVVGPKGTSALDATPGTIGHQEVRPDQPGAEAAPPPETIADVKISSLLAKLGMGADTLATPNPSGDGSPGASGGEGAGRKDIGTNLGMGRDMIVPQGGTHQTPPAVPVPLKATPGAGEKVQKDKPANDAQDDVKKAAAVLLQTANGRDILNKLSAVQTEKEAEQATAVSILQRALGNTASSIL